MSRKSVRSSLVSDALSEEEYVDDPDTVAPGDLPEPAPVAVTPAAPVAVPALAMTPEQLQAIVTAAVQAASQGGAGALGEVMTEALQRARQKKPENETHHGKSTLNPVGDLERPRPPAKAEFWHGFIENKTKQVQLVIPIAGVKNLDGLCSYDELVALNTLEPVKVTYRCTNNSEVLVRVVTEEGAGGEVARYVICWPEGFFTDKFKRNTIGPIVDMVGKLMKGEPVAA